MTGKELVDAALQFYDNTIATDAENANRRLRILHYAQMVSDEIWNWKSWPFKFATGSVAATGGAGPLPTDFSRLGTEGLVWEGSTFWTEGFPGDVIAMQVKSATGYRIFAVTTKTNVTTLYSGTDATAALGASAVVFPTATLPTSIRVGDRLNFTAVPETLLVSARTGDTAVTTQTPTTLDHSTPETYTIQRDITAPSLIIPDVGARTLSVYYEKVPPTVVDDVAPLGDIVGIPLSHQGTVLLAGTLAKTQMAKNDVRVYWERQYAMGLGRMVVNEMPLAGRMKQLPMAVGSNNC